MMNLALRSVVPRDRTASGEMMTMYKHGPNCLRGPVSRGRRNWRAARRKGHDNRLAHTAEPPVRLELIARVRAEILAGTYDTPEKWELALERLGERLEWE